MPEPCTDTPGSNVERYVDGSSLRVGVLTNPRSGGNRKGGQGVRDVLSRWPETIQREATNPADIARVLADFSDCGVELLVVNGGDGTVQAALTTLINEEVFTAPPLLALLHAGTTSMLPRDVGVAGSPAAGLARTLAWAHATHPGLVIRSRPVIKVQRGGGRQPLCGMFFGAGAICQGIRTFHSKDNPNGRRGQLLPAITMIKFLMAFIRKDHDNIPPFRAQTRLDGNPVAVRDDLLVLVSTLERLFFGIRPYWGEGDGPLRYTAIGYESRCLLRVLFSLFRAGRNRYATAENGYFSYNVGEVQLDLDGEFTLDGELYHAGEGTLTISPVGPFEFVCSR